MSKAVRLRSNIEYKVLLLEGNPQFENFYKEELIQFCKTARNILLEQRQENQQLKEDYKVLRNLHSIGLNELNETQQQRNLYKSVIDEVREYVKRYPTKTWYYAKRKSSKNFDFEIVRCDKELLEIIAKAKGSEINDR